MANQPNTNQVLEFQQENLMALLFTKLLDCKRDMLYQNIHSFIKGLNSTLENKNIISYHKASEVKICLDKIHKELSDQYPNMATNGIYPFLSKECSKEKIYQYTEPLNYEMISQCFGEIEPYVCKLVLS
jgi:hypothetical protein